MHQSVGHFNCLLIQTTKCYINCQPREVCLFQRQSHTVYAQSQKQWNFLVTIMLITPCLNKLKFYSELQQEQSLCCRQLSKESWIMLKRTI